MAAYLGIDVSKATLDVALLRHEHTKSRHRVFPNTPSGHQQLVAWLNTMSDEPVHACLESTGTYGEAVALTLHQAKHLVSVVNPALIRAFGQSELSRTKTDKADAQRIARFCRTHQPPAWSPPAPELRELQALVRRLEALDQMQRMEQNRLDTGVESPTVHAQLQEHVAYLQGQMEAVRQMIRSHIDQNPTLKSQRDLLTSIPGIAETTAALILAELGQAKRFQNARQVAAFAGLVPRLRQSGTSVRGRSMLSKMGSSRLRKALFFPAMSALKWNPFLKALGERLQAQGKSKMLIVGAAMRKLLHLCFGVLKSGQPFNPNFTASNS
jgi:transposase